MSSCYIQSPASCFSRILINTLLRMLTLQLEFVLRNCYIFHDLKNIGASGLLLLPCWSAPTFFLVLFLFYFALLLLPQMTLRKTFWRTNCWEQTFPTWYCFSWYRVLGTELLTVSTCLMQWFFKIFFYFHCIAFPRWGC